jgi:ribonuclease-3
MGSIPDERLDALEARLGFAFRDRSLLGQALTHRSYSHESGGQPLASNERLEFLGDAALESALAFHLYEAHPGWRRGELSRVRAAAVSRSTLAQIGAELALGEFLLLGQGEERSGGRQRVSVLADAVEALAGAVYLETIGTNRFRYAAHPVVRTIGGPVLQAIVRQEPDVAYQAFLEDLVASIGSALPPTVTAAHLRDDHDRITALENRLGSTFRDPGLLKQALTHASYHPPGPDDPGLSNGRLAFVGASFVNLAVATVLYFMCPHRSEAQLTRLRTIAASNAALGRLGSALGLDEFLFLGAAEEGSGGRTRPSTLADAVKAILAAALLDAPELDSERLAFRQFALRLVGRSLEAIEAHPYHIDPKGVLQERSEKALGIRPVYGLVSASGDEHERTYVVEVRLGEEVAGVGKGSSRKAAEQAAASQALENLESGALGSGP